MLTSIENIKKRINDGSYDSRFLRIYEDIELQKKRYLAAASKFEEYFAGEKCFMISVPSAVKFFGEDAESKNAAALFSAVSLDTIAVVGKRKDSTVNVRFAQDEKVYSTDLSDEADSLPARLIRSIGEGFSKWKLNTGGFDMYVHTDVPSQLAFDACFSVLIGTVFAYLYNDDSVAPYKIALIGKRALGECLYAPCDMGALITCAVGGSLKIDFADSDTPDFSRLLFECVQNGYRLCKVKTKNSRMRPSPIEIKQIKTVCELLDNGNFDGFVGVLRKNSAKKSAKPYKLCNDILNGKGALRVLSGGVIQAYVPEKDYAKFKKGAEELFGKDSVYTLDFRSCGAAFFA